MASEIVKLIKELKNMKQELNSSSSKMNQKMNDSEKTINYYDVNAESFVETTRSVDFTLIQEKFMSYMSIDSLILDFGCGSGRDTKAFLKQGYLVEAVDGSSQLCKLATEYTGILVKHMLFQELEEVEKYDGVWACSSILHLPSLELTDVLKRIHRALKKQGYLYTSFKYGEFEGIRNERYFIDFTEEKLKEYLQRVGGFQIVDLVITSDVRPGRDQEKWLNVILQKCK